jgi:hypothetical protein
MFKKNFIFQTLLLIFSFILINSAVYSQVFHTVNFSKVNLGISTKTGEDGIEYDQITLTGLNYNGQIGAPQLPVKYVHLIVPSGVDAASVNIISKQTEQFTIEHRIYPVQYLIPTSIDYIKPDFVTPDNRIYQAEKAFPEKIVQIDQQGYFDGSTHIVTCAVYPIQYNPLTNQLIFHSSIHFSLDMGSESKLKPMRLTIRKEENQKMYDAILKQLVDNPADIASYQVKPARIQKTLNKVLTGTLPYYEYVIITSDVAKACFNEFIRWKRRKGLDIGIVTTEEITADGYNSDNISDITDQAGGIRQYLADAYSSGTTIFALLAGDHYIMPVRYGCGNNNYWTRPQTNPVEDDFKIPADIYYADFNGDWDVDGVDSVDMVIRYGERNDDAPDYNPEIFVGRLPFSINSMVSDIANWTQKVLLYEQNPGKGNASYLTRSFMHQADQMQGDNEAASVRNALPSVFNNGNDPIWEEVPSWYSPNPSFPYGNQVINHMNSTKYGLWSWFNHGGVKGVTTKSNLVNKPPFYGIRTTLNTPTGGVYENGNGLDCLTNKDYPAIVYSIGCDNAAFDDFKYGSSVRSAAEGFTVITNKGGPAFLGNTRYGWTAGHSRDLYINFADLLDDGTNDPESGESYFHLGVAEMVSKQNLPLDSTNYYGHYLKYSHNLFGCPETKIWTNTPAQYTNVVITDNGSSLTVNSNVSGSNICASSIDNGNSYHWLESNVTNYTFNTPVRPLYVTITKHNYLPYCYTTSVNQYSGTLTQNVTWSGEYLIGDVIVPNGKTLTITPGTNINILPLKSLVVQPGGHVRTYGTPQGDGITRFKQANPGSIWFKVEIQGSCNFTNTVFDGGSANMIIKGNNCVFNSCSFVNGHDGIKTWSQLNGNRSKYYLNDCIIQNNFYGGIWSQDSEGGMDNCKVVGNGADGIAIYRSSLGNDYDADLFTNNLIEKNGDWGIRIFYDGEICFGFIYQEGYNRVVNNGGTPRSEIYLASWAARLYESSNGAHSDIYDLDLGYYVYNLAKSSDSEGAVSVTVPLQHCFWNSASSSEIAERFYGPVDYTPFHTTSQAANAGQNDAPLLKMYTLKDQSDQELITVKERISDLKSEINLDPSEMKNAKKLIEMYFLSLDKDPQDNLAEKNKILNMIASYRKKLDDLYNNKTDLEIKIIQSDTIKTMRAKRLVGEVAVILEIDNYLRQKEYDQVLNKIEKYDQYIVNPDNRRELLSIKIAALEDQGDYIGALITLQQLKEEVKKTDEDWDNYDPPDYTLLERHLRDLAGLGENDPIPKQKFANSFEIPKEFELAQNYPNPFNPTTIIPLNLPEKSVVTIKVYNILGQVVEKIVNKKSYQAGRYQFDFNGSNLASGLYIVTAQMETENEKSYTFSRKMLLIK